MGISPHELNTQPCQQHPCQHAWASGSATFSFIDDSRVLTTNSRQSRAWGGWEKQILNCSLQPQNTHTQKDADMTHPFLNQRFMSLNLHPLASPSGSVSWDLTGLPQGKLSHLGPDLRPEGTSDPLSSP